MKLPCNNSMTARVDPQEGQGIVVTALNKQRECEGLNMNSCAKRYMIPIAIPLTISE